MANRSDGVRGAGRLSRWPVRSASTVWTYSLRASISQPISADDEGERRRPPAASRRRRARGTAARSRARRGSAGTTGRACGRRAAGPSWTRAGRAVRRRLDVVVVDAQPLGQPVEQGQDQRDRPRGPGPRRRRRGPRNSRNVPIAAKIGANDGPGMWMPAGVRGGTRRTPRRAGGGRQQSPEGPDAGRSRPGPRCRPAGSAIEHAPVRDDELRQSARGCRSRVVRAWVGRIRRATRAASGGSRERERSGSLLR